MRLRDSHLAHLGPLYNTKSTTFFLRAASTFSCGYCLAQHIFLFIPILYLCLGVGVRYRQAQMASEGGDDVDVLWERIGNCRTAVQGLACEVEFSSHHSLWHWAPSCNAPAHRRRHILLTAVPRRTPACTKSFSSSALSSNWIEAGISNCEASLRLDQHPSATSHVRVFSAMCQCFQIVKFIYVLTLDAITVTARNVRDGNLAISSADGDLSLCSQCWTAYDSEERTISRNFSNVSRIRWPPLQVSSCKFYSLNQKFITLIVI